MMRGRSGKEPKNSAGFQDMTNAVSDDTAARQDAFRRHVEPEIDVLLRVGRTLTGSWADTEDLVQDTLIRAYRGIDRFDGSHPRAWLLTILRNTNLNSLRRQRPVLLEESAEIDQHRPAFGAAAAPSPEDTVTDLILDDDLQRAVNSLDARFRTVLLLIDVDQLSYAEAAEVLGIPVGTVMSRLSRARDRVRTKLPKRHTSRRTG